MVIFVKNFKTVQAFISSVRPSVRRRHAITFSFVIHRQKFIILYVSRRSIDLCYAGMGWDDDCGRGGRVIAKVSIRVCAYVQLFDI